MIVIKKEYEHYINIDYEINLNNGMNFNIHIVYFINCLVNDNYFDWLYNQLKLVINMNGTIYVIATIDPCKEESFKSNVTLFFPNIIIICYYENEFEYRGIHKVWELGQIHNKPNDIILYFHSKGLTHHNCYQQNKYDEYNIILYDINKIKEIFSIFPKIDKIGYSSGGNGWIWYNFWYARGSYIFSVEEPIKTTRRHYYEDWLGRKVDINDKYCETERPFTHYKNTLDTCYGFHTDKSIIANIGSCFNPSGVYHNI
jgi:hypothetical protein